MPTTPETIILVGGAGIVTIVVANNLFNRVDKRIDDTINAAGKTFFGTLTEEQKLVRSVYLQAQSDIGSPSWVASQFHELLTVDWERALYVHAIWAPPRVDWHAIRSMYHQYLAEMTETDFKREIIKAYGILYARDLWTVLNDEYRSFGASQWGYPPTFSDFLVASI